MQTAHCFVLKAEWLLQSALCDDSLRGTSSIYGMSMAWVELWSSPRTAMVTTVRRISSLREVFDIIWNWIFFCRDSIRAICSKYSQVYYANCVHMFDSIWWLINGHARMIWEREENDRPTGDSVMRYTRLDFFFCFIPVVVKRNVKKYKWMTL